MSVNYPMTALNAAGIRSPRPCRGGAGGGVSIILSAKKILPQHLLTPAPDPAP